MSLGGTVVSGAKDALAGPPDYLSGPNYYVWAPTVRYFGGRYLMMFSAQQSDGRMCISVATSSSRSGPFNIVEVNGRDYKLCSSNGNVIDPQLYIEGSTAFFLYSKIADNLSSSEIRIQPLGAFGLPTGGYSTLVTLNQARAALDGQNLGSRAVIENPALVRDPYNGYDLLVSMGTWNQPGAYHTIEIPCIERYRNCLPSNGGPPGNTLGTNPGGLSLLQDQSPNLNYAIWHSYNGSSATGPRLARGAVTQAVDWQVLSRQSTLTAPAEAGEKSSEARSGQLVIPTVDAEVAARASTANERLGIRPVPGSRSGAP
jgi:hypothetical protein